MSTSPIYTVYVRVPFPRGDFVDPPPVRLLPSMLSFMDALAEDLKVEWDAAKERSLWKVLSKASKNSDIDCKSHNHRCTDCTGLTSYRESIVRIPSRVT